MWLLGNTGLNIIVDSFANNLYGKLSGSRTCNLVTEGAHTVHPQNN